MTRHRKTDEIRIHGDNACLAVFKHRPESIAKAWLSEAMAPRAGELMRYLASHRKGYRIVSPDELTRLAQSEHHGGIVLATTRPETITMPDLLKHLARHSQPVCILALDNVGNPHNLGALMRTAAHFDTTYLLHEQPGLLLSAAATRVAEGGLEHVQIVDARQLPEALQELQQAGFAIVTTSSHRGSNLFTTRLPTRCVIVLGEEQRGLSRHVEACSTHAVCIPGSGLVESLNVSVAGAMLLGEWYRQHIPSSA